MPPLQSSCAYTWPCPRRVSRSSLPPRGAIRKPSLKAHPEQCHSPFGTAVRPEALRPVVDCKRNQEQWLPSFAEYHYFLCKATAHSLPIECRAPCSLVGSKLPDSLLGSKLPKSLVGSKLPGSLVSSKLPESPRGSKSRVTSPRGSKSRMTSPRGSKSCDSPRGSRP